MYSSESFTLGQTGHNFQYGATAIDGVCTHCSEHVHTGLELWVWSVVDLSCLWEGLRAAEKWGSIGGYRCSLLECPAVAVYR